MSGLTCCTSRGELLGIAVVVAGILLVDAVVSGTGELLPIVAAAVLVPAYGRVHGRLFEPDQQSCCEGC